MSATATPLLTAATVGAYLAGRGLVAAAEQVEAVELGGGVSNVVLAVDAPDLSAVVKQARPRLRVADEWLAKRERALAEARALALAARLAPDAVPTVLDVDEDACAFVIERAPRSWRSWKDDLLAGTVDASVARRLGRLLAAWHAAAAEPDVARDFGDLTAFEQLRIDPYHRTVIARHPDLAGPVGACAAELLVPGTALVHGDFSPKNVLVGPDGSWVIDWEVVHVGSSVFDLAFMLNHLLLKCVHRPAAREALVGGAAAFLGGYADAGGTLPSARALLVHTGCLTVARVDGKSPAEYLTPAGRETARRLGRALLLEPPATVTDAFARLG
jgi:5-methylthioribose kinase